MVSVWKIKDMWKRWSLSFRAPSVGGVLISLILKILGVKLWTFVAYACFYFGLIRKFFLICREPVTSSAMPYALPSAHLCALFHQVLPILFVISWSSFLPQDLCTARPSAWGLPFFFPHSFAWLNLMYPFGLSLKVACLEKTFQREWMFASFTEESGFLIVSNRKCTLSRNEAYEGISRHS